MKSETRRRTVNAKPFAAQDTVAVADVKAMVNDRRSASGQKNGGVPTHLPAPAISADRITDDEAAMMQHLAEEARHRQAARQGAEIDERTSIEALNAGMRHLIKKYGLRGSDSVNVETGMIARAGEEATP